MHSQFIYGLDLEYTIRELLVYCRSAFQNLDSRLNSETSKIRLLLTKKSMLDSYASSGGSFQPLSSEENRRIAKFKNTRETIRQHKLLIARDMSLMEEFLIRVPRKESKK